MCGFTANLAGLLIALNVNRYWLLVLTDISDAVNENDFMTLEIWIFLRHSLFRISVVFYVAR